MQPLVSVHASLRHLPDGVSGWLGATAGQANLYDEPAWYDVFTAHVPPAPGERDEWWLLRRDARPLALLPMRRSAARGWRGDRLQSMTNYYTARHAPPLAEDVSAADLATLLRAMGRSASIDGQPRAGATELQWDALVAEAPAWQRLRDAAHAAGWWTSEHPSSVNWSTPVTGDADAMWAARPGSLKNTARRMRRRFEAAGGRLEILQGRDAIERGLSAYLTVYAASWKPAEAHAGFMPALIQRAAEAGWLRLGIAWLGDRPAAAHVWLVHANRADIFKLAYDETLATHSPGTLIGEALWRHVIDHDHVDVIDYLTGDDPYKRLWMTERRERLSLQAWRRGHPAGWVMAARAAASDWKRRRATTATADRHARADGAAEA